MANYCPDSSVVKQKGQVLLIVVLVMIVALTVGLSLISRSITNLRTSTEEAESQKALAAAEAGIEQVLEREGSDPLTGTFSSGGVDIKYRTEVSRIKGLEFLLNGGNSVPKDDGADVWLSNYSDDESLIFASPRSGTVSLFYVETSVDSCTTPPLSAPALEISVISGSKDNPTLQRYTDDPCSIREEKNNFNSDTSIVRGSGGVVDKVTFSRNVEIPITNGLIMRLIPVYKNARIGIKFSPDVSSPPELQELPFQGKLVTSTGEAGKTHRKINVFQGHPRIPAELLPYAIFSPKD